MTAPRTVLIVDDKRDVADTYAIWLRDEYEVRTAYSGAEALEQLDAAVDVVLLDRRMPDLHGDEVLERIRDRDLDCRVAMVTAVEPDFDIIGMGFDTYLVKPVFGDELLETIDHLLARTEYESDVREYFALASKKSILEAEKTRAELEASDEYAALMERLSDIRAELDAVLAGFEVDDYSVAFRDIDSRDE